MRPRPEHCRRLLWLSVLLLTAWPAQAQRLPIKSYTTAEGLANNEVRRIVRDSRGFLWFCTADGLSQFDGYGFTNFGIEQGLPSGSINDLLETRGGDYWLATDAGVVRFDPKGKPGPRAVPGNEAATPAPMFTVVAPDDEDRRARAITVLREGRDGAIWAGSNKHLYRLDVTNGRRLLRIVDIGMPDEYPEQRAITDVIEDSLGSLWIATPSGLYRRWPDGSAAHYTARDGLPWQYLNDLLVDRAGHLWAGARDGGAFRFSADATHNPPIVDLTLSQNDGLPNGWVTALFEASDRHLWVATALGVAEFSLAVDAEGPRFRSYSSRNGVSERGTTAFAEDLDGNLWMGTFTTGVTKIARDGFTTYGPQDGIDGVNAIFEDRAGNLCFRGHVPGDVLRSVYEGAKLDLLDPRPLGSHIRLGSFDGRRFDWFHPAAVSHIGWVLEAVTLQARSGEWWVGTEEGLFRFPAADRCSSLKTARPLVVFRTPADGLATGQVFRLFEDSRGDVWVSTISSATNGLARWDKQSQRLRDLAHSPGLPPIEDELPRSFGEDPSGNVWIGFNSGLVRHAHGRFTFFTVRDGLPAGAIMNIYVDRSGRLWLASAAGGLIRVDNPGAARPLFTSYTTMQGLSSNSIRVIVEDAYGHLYVGGGHGLDRLDPATGRVKHFTAADGLVTGLAVAAHRDRNGVLWFGMTNGLARLTPGPEKATAPLRVLITSVRVGDVPQPVSALGEQKMSLPALAARQTPLQIEFVGLAFGPGEVLQYQFRLAGAESGWSALTAQRVVTYASLSPGTYTFIVRAVNAEGVTSVRPASLAFTVLRPIWQRWWFLSLVGLALGLMAHRFYRSRLARLLEMANMRTRIATDLHDDIGANLTRIALLSEVAQQAERAGRRDSGSPGEAPEHDAQLASIASIARESVASMSDIVWAINPARDSLVDIVSRMRRHAEEIFTLRDIALRFDAPGAADNVKLGVDVRRDLLLIFKEAVNNAARHSGCSRVEIDLGREGSRLVLRMADNGVGFDTSLESEGQGLTSMQRRARRLNGTLEIASTSGAGTTVTLAIPA